MGQHGTRGAGLWCQMRTQTAPTAKPQLGILRSYDIQCKLYRWTGEIGTSIEKLGRLSPLLRTGSVFDEHTFILARPNEVGRKSRKVQLRGKLALQTRGQRRVRSADGRPAFATEARAPLPGRRPARWRA